VRLNLKEDTMAAAAVFCAFLAPFVALIAGLTLITFSPLKRVSRAKKLLVLLFFVGGITALGWAPIVVSSSIGLWAYVSVLAISSLYQAIVILFVSAEMLTEKLIDEPARSSLHPSPGYSSCKVR
jgi:hypothetical protein